MSVIFNCEKCGGEIWVSWNSQVEEYRQQSIKKNRMCKCEKSELSKIFKDKK